MILDKKLAAGDVIVLDGATGTENLPFVHICGYSPQTGSRHSLGLWGLWHNR